MSIKSKKILIINTYFSPVGGAEIIAYETYKMLKEKGYNVYFWACNKKPYFDKIYEYQNYFTEYDTSIKNYLSWYYNRKAENDLQKFINEIKPDIIHLHGFISYLSPSVLKCCKKIPTVATLHDAAIVCPSVKMLYKNKSYCKNIKCKQGHYYNCILNNCTKNFESCIRKTIRAYITKRYLSNIDTFITPSKALKDLIVSADIGINDNKIDVVNNFVSIYKKEDLQNTNDSNKYFLYVGRLSKEKGINYLLEVQKELNNLLKIHIVGTGPEENRLKKYAQINNLNNVKFLGFKNKEEMKEEYKNCIATILPCNWFENFPTTVLESFGYGKPVIASNIGGISEQIEHNKTGLLFEPTNTEQLKSCMLLYLNNEYLSQQHGLNAYSKAKNLYTRQKYFQNLLNVYDKLLNQKLQEFIN